MEKVVLRKDYSDTSRQAYSEEELMQIMSEARDKLPRIVSRHARSMGIDYEKVLVKSQRTRWGSCSDRGNISLNCLLVQVPSFVRKYVIIHELAHRIEMNHSTAFWHLVSSEMPDYRRAIEWLDTNGEEMIDRLG
ncbi:M48 metallopeptidase family protein [Butyrivibrio sp. WCD3002]|uniref:M48 metallopeptidase family protein n=1 Tax=Butyrivibrio sp. WCD3002 TaxID=1280676 RepID=UPI000567BE9C|nr:M48 family metallopeptidase [Butyrivibrio sp. WCD3002]